MRWLLQSQKVDFIIDNVFQLFSLYLLLCYDPSQRQRLINTTETRVNVITNGDSDSAARAAGRRGCDNGSTGVAEQGLNGRCQLQRLRSGNEAEHESDDENKNGAEAEGEDGSNGPMVPFRVPGTAHVTGNNGLNELS